MELITVMTWFLLASVFLLLTFSGLRSGLIVATVVELAYMGRRGVEVGRIPLLGPHDTLMFLGLSLTALGFVTSFASALAGRKCFLRLVGGVGAVVVLAAMPFRPLNMPLPQILDTAWFELHVALAFFAYALFVIGGVVSCMFLHSKDKALLDPVYKILLVGWSLFSASMVSGGIWGYFAWGTYWLWTAKELWTSILWLIYAMILHIRLKGAHFDAIFAWGAVIGVPLMLFTYLGVSMMMKSSHSF